MKMDVANFFYFLQDCVQRDGDGKTISRCSGGGGGSSRSSRYTLLQVVSGKDERVERASSE